MVRVHRGIRAGQRGLPTTWSVPVRPPSCWRSSSSQEGTRKISTKRSGCSPSRYSFPAGRPGSEPGEPELVHRSQKGRLPLRHDGEMNCDQHWSGIRIGFDCNPAGRPVGGGLRVDVAGLGQPPDQAGGDPCNHDNSCREDGRPQRDSVGDESEDEGRQRRRSQHSDPYRNARAGPTLTWHSAGRSPSSMCC